MNYFMSLFCYSRELFSFIESVVYRQPAIGDTLLIFYAMAVETHSSYGFCRMKKTIPALYSFIYNRTNFTK